MVLDQEIEIVRGSLAKIVARKEWSGRIPSATSKNFNLPQKLPENHTFADRASRGRGRIPFAESARLPMAGEFRQAMVTVAVHLA
jgi:hypothetical protein